MAKSNLIFLVKINNEFGKNLNNIHKFRKPVRVFNKHMFILAKSVEIPAEDFITINVDIENDKQKGDFMITVPADYIEYYIRVGSMEKIEKICGFSNK